jgi:hypothetical protein
MPLRMAITKDVGGGEQVVVDVCQWNPVTGEIMHGDFTEMKALFEAALDMAEDRMQDMVLRIMETAQLRQYCTPEEWDKIVSVTDIIAGRVDAHQVAKRWHDTREENEMLAEGRRHAAEVVQQQFVAEMQALEVIDKSTSEDVLLHAALQDHQS